MKSEIKVDEICWCEAKTTDLCCHGKLHFSINDYLVSDGTDEWNLTWASFNLLDTVFNDYEGDDLLDPERNQLIPCCGFSFIKSGSRIVTLGCDSGIDWIIYSRTNSITHKFDSFMFEMSRSDWASLNIELTEKIISFYGRESIRTPISSDDGFWEFCKRWKIRYEKVIDFLGEQSKWSSLTNGKLNNFC